jgi:acyl-coenzyme A synthetase/AMP-(fatty) acid ligase
VTTAFGDILAAYGDRILARDDSGAAVGYAEALDRGHKLIASLGTERKLVILLTSNTVESVAAYAALLAAGHPTLLLDRAIAQPLLDRMVAIYRPDAVLVAEDGAEGLMRSDTGAARPLHDDLGVLLSTSGSTGSPKLARFRLESVLENARAIADYLAIGPEERPLLHLPINYSYGFSILNSHLLQGATIELTRYSLMERPFWDRFNAAEATSFSGVPFHYEMLHRLGFQRIRAPSLKTLTQAGGRLSPELVVHFAEQAAARDIDFYVMYGQTEAGPRISYLPPGLAAVHPGSMGKPIPGVMLELLDEAGHPVADGEEGELVCQSPAVMMGYAETAEDLALGDEMGGRLATGDLARRGAEGLYYITGRKSRFLKLMGTRVNLDEVEAHARAMGEQPACVGSDDWLCLVLEDSDAARAEAVRQSIIESFKFPPRCLETRLMTEIPRSETGKPRYGALLDKVQIADGKVGA